MQEEGEQSNLLQGPLQEDYKIGLSGGVQGPHTQLVVGASGDPRNK